MDKEKDFLEKLSAKLFEEIKDSDLTEVREMIEKRMEELAEKE